MCDQEGLTRQERDPRRSMGPQAFAVMCPAKHRSSLLLRVGLRASKTLEVSPKHLFSAVIGIEVGVYD